MAKAGEQDPHQDTPRDLAMDIDQFISDVDDPEAVYEKMEAGDFEEAFQMMGLTPDQAESVARSWFERAKAILLRTNR
jgi:hypothetical protein